MGAFSCSLRRANGFVFVVAVVGVLCSVSSLAVAHRIRHPVVPTTHEAGAPAQHPPADSDTRLPKHHRLTLRGTWMISDDRVSPEMVYATNETWSFWNALVDHIKVPTGPIRKSPVPSRAQMRREGTHRVEISPANRTYEIPPLSSSFLQVGPSRFLSFASRPGFLTKEDGLMGIYLKVTNKSERKGVSAWEEDQDSEVENPADSVAGFSAPDDDDFLDEDACDFVDGHVLVRDGRYPTSEDISLLVTGLYFHKNSSFELIGSSVLPSSLNYSSGSISTVQELHAFAENWQNRTIEKAERIGLDQFQNSEEFIARGYGRYEGPSGSGDGYRSNSGVVEFKSVLGDRDESAASSMLPFHDALPLWRRSTLCVLKISLSSKEVEIPGEGSQGKPVIRTKWVGGVRISDRCGGLQLNVTSEEFDHATYLQRAHVYCFLGILVASGLVLIVAREMKRQRHQTRIASISSGMVGMQGVIDAYMCMFHLTFGIMVEEAFHAFGSIAFIHFLLFAVFCMRLMLLIWRARTSHSSLVSDFDVRREMASLYSRFYAVVFGGILLIYRSAAAIKIFMLILYAYYLPQIVKNCRSSSRRPISRFYIIGSAALRLFAPLYFYGYSGNFLELQSDHLFCLALIAESTVLTALLVSQYSWGATWFIPKPFLGPKYEYYRKAPPEISGDDCAICMHPLVDTEEGTSQQTMLTPCNHWFHSGCLERWMSVKLECPVCRRKLPPCDDVL